MDSVHSIPRFRVLRASTPCSTRCMRVGWKSLDEGILVPKSRLPCDVLHLSGIVPSDADAFAAEVAEVCREVGADAVFWEPETADKHALEIVSLWKTRRVLRVYSPLSALGGIPVVSDLSGPLPPQTAAAVIARAAITVIQNGKAEKHRAAPGEIDALIETHRPEIAFSAELAANFFTLRQNDATIFAVFDTEETIASRVTRAEKAGAVAVFCDNCEKI